MLVFVPVCSGKDKFTEFRNISEQINSLAFKKKLIRRGCFVPNCITKKWLRVDQEVEDTGETYTTISFEVNSNSKTMVRREIRLADYWTFLADCGGYLGLYVGGSVLSLSEFIVSFIKKIWNRVCKNCNETQHQV